MIGLVDYNLYSSTSTNLLIPNLEIMKLAAYYKLEKNTFCRLIDFEEKDLTMYEKIFFFSEGENPPSIPEQFLRADNVIYGGTAFTNGVYIPFQNEVIDYTLPRTNIYANFLKQKYNDGVKAKVISHTLDDSYYRMYAGENKLPLPIVQTNKRIFIYDKDFFYSDWEEIIDELSGRRPSSIVRIHPIICKTLTHYFTLRSKQKVARATEIILDLDIPLAEVDYMLKHYSNFFLADIASNSNVYIPLGGSFVSNKLYYQDFIYKMNLLYAFWSRGIKIKIKFILPKLGYTNPIYNLSYAVERWTTNYFIGKRKNPRSINMNIIKKTKKEISQEQEERDKIIQLMPFSADLFDQTYEQIQKEGRWRL